MNEFKHGGNLWKLARTTGRPMKELLDFSANINPMGPPPWLSALLRAEAGSLVHYPDPDCTALTEAICSRYGCAKEEVIIGNGTAEIIYALPRAFSGFTAVIPVPSYSDYAQACERDGLEIKRIVLSAEKGFEFDPATLEPCLSRPSLVFLAQPNNPTGRTFSAEALHQTALRHPSSVFVIDEAFADFVEHPDRLVSNRPANVVVLCSLTKFFAIPGLRLGFALADGPLAERIRSSLPPWSVNTLAQKVGEQALKDRDYFERSRTLIKSLKTQFLTELSSLPGLTVFPGEANFLLIRLDRPDLTAPVLAEKMLAQEIAIRVCANFDGLDERYFRVAVRTEEENNQFLKALRSVLQIPLPLIKKRKTTPALMFQGTSSNVGKSILTAALCRILLQDGYRVAPFKSQNMSLNSFVTRDGGEMGRAQVVQAYASRLDPDVRMNPVLLKPNTDTGAQVIVQGQPVGNMDVGEYIPYKPQAFAKAKESYDSLSREFEVIVLEGAGSPAEINLKQHDMVNMRMAEYAGAPVLLIGDIDRGGVFASFVGTMELLDDWERRLVAGLVINRFRGKESLLESAITFTERHTGCPILGVVPYLRDLGLPEEDSVAFKSGALEGALSTNHDIEVAVIDLPHISNFTDFDCLRLEPDIRVRIVRRAQDLDHPAAVILPGSKNVIGDLNYLKENGLDQKINALAEEGRTEIIGICGGFQMLGREIADPYGLESAGQTITGLGLLPVSTVLEKQKTLTRVQACHQESQLAVQGYEIHHGQTKGDTLKTCFVRDDGLEIGTGTMDGKIWGTYLHGVFDADEFRRWFIDRLRQRQGLQPQGKILVRYELESALDRLAETVRRTLDIKRIYQIIGLK
jgi:cobyric acid synthase CobQ/L-threonine-O-3-phosphate decarboxylase